MGTQLVKINLQESIDTDSPAQSLNPFDQELGPSPYEKNNGIERAGGIRPLYQTRVQKTGVSYVQYTKSGKKVELSYAAGSGSIAIDGETIGGLTTPYGPVYNVRFPYQAYDVISAGVANRFDALLKVSGALYLQRWEYTPSTGAWTKISEIAIDSRIVDSHISTTIVRGSVDYVTQANNKFVCSGIAASNNIYYKSGNYTTVDTIAYTSPGVFVGWKVAGDADFVIVRMDQPYTYIGATATARAGYGWPSVSADGAVIYVYRVPTTAQQVGIAINIATGAETAINLTSIPTVIHSYINVMGGVFVSYDYATGSGTNVVMGNTVYLRNALRCFATEAIGKQAANTAEGYTHTYNYYTVNGMLSHLGGESGSGYGGLISEVGELSPDYPISVIPGINNLVYKTFDGSFKCAGIAQAFDTVLQLADDEVVSIGFHTQGGNIVDVAARKLRYGQTAFNNAIIIAIPYASPGVAKTFAARLDGGKYFQSVDVGERPYINVGTLAASHYWEYIPNGSGSSRESSSAAFDFFEDGIYVGTAISQGTAKGGVSDYLALSKIIYPGKVDTVYIQDYTVPIPVHAMISESAARTSDKTFFRYDKRIGYQMGNELPYTSTAFMLFGNTYVFGGDTIFAATFDSGGALSSVDRMAIADGLTYLAVTPTEAWFLSAYDNSLWTFDGGRSVKKAMRLNEKSAIVKAAYNVGANELALLSGTGTTIIYIRDGIVSETILDVTGTGTKVLQPTNSGTWLVVQGGAGYMAKTHFANLAGSSILALDWQTGYQGLGNFQRVTVQEYLFTVYDAAKTAGTVSIEWNGFTETAPVTAETRTITLAYDSAGYARFSFIPANGNVLGSSIRLQTALPITILAGTIKIGDAPAGLATVTNRGV